MCKWKKTKGLYQQTDLKTEYPYFSCLHEVTFIKSPFECSNSNNVHQQNTIKQLFKLHSLKLTTFFLRVKSWKSGVIGSFHMKFRKKSGFLKIRGKSGIIRKNLEVLFFRVSHPFRRLVSDRILSEHTAFMNQYGCLTPSNVRLGRQETEATLLCRAAQLIGADSCRMSYLTLSRLHWHKKHPE